MRRHAPRWPAIFVLALLCWVHAAFAFDSQQTERASRLAGELRCLVCQNQSVAESSAPFAVDLRQQIAEGIDAGRTDGEILALLASRYGDFVLYKPRFDARNLGLWLAPFLLLVGGLWMLRRSLLEHRRLAVEEAELSLAERDRIEHLLRDRGQGAG